LLDRPEAGESFCESARGGLISTDFPNTTPVTVYFSINFAKILRTDVTF
jgi:hypothetical protein